MEVCQILGLWRKAGVEIQDLEYTQGRVNYAYTNQIGSQDFNLGSRPASKAQS